MKFDDPTDDPMEATMIDITTPRYGFAPTAAFATTRAGAERRARETASAAAKAESRPVPSLFRRLVTLFVTSAS